MAYSGICRVYCPICRTPMDYLRAYGHDCRCCSKDCHDEFLRREARAFLDHPRADREPLPLIPTPTAS